MKVIFTQDVPDVAKSGQMKEVTDGYARNFLFPRNLAVMANRGTLNAMAAKMEARAKADAQAEADNKKIAQEINNREIFVEAKSGGSERLYGSITTTDIAEAIQEATGYEVDKRKIKTQGTINSLGTHKAEIRLAKDIVPVVRVTVTAEQPAEEKE